MKQPWVLSNGYYEVGDYTPPHNRDDFTGKFMINRAGLGGDFHNDVMRVCTDSRAQVELIVEALNKLDLEAAATTQTYGPKE